eukprot:c52702_g1_i1.p2 GENE.c52702_g1_i1~~c52702_g1_i1.p2  ORF type:complete len:168 (-),score=32.24 c52702_g1_i1:34-507(-)
MAEQIEKAFLKQPHVNLGKKRPQIQGKKARVGVRFVKNIGLGFPTPREAATGAYIDKKCPFTGAVSIRGRILSGVVKSTKMNRTIIVRRDYLHYIKKYQRFQKRHSNTPAHLSPAFRVNDGDEVTIGECRPLSKTVRFNVIKVTPRGGAQGKSFSKF